MPKFLIIDSHSVLHRAFHALPPLKTKEGKLVNAVYGYLLVFFRALKEIQPDFIAAVFDSAGPTFRHKEFKDYKANRPIHPPEFYEQVSKLKELLREIKIAIFEKPGFEADDLVGTINFLIQKKQLFPKIETIILSSDLDILQIADATTKIWVMRKGIKDIVLWGVKEIEERFGILPSQLPDFRGLKGDPSDNIPGVPGIGEKSALSLIKEFTSLENLYREIEERTERSKKIRGKIKEALQKYKEEAFFSKKLSEIQKNVPLDFEINECSLDGFDYQKAKAAFEKMNFVSLIKRLPQAPLFFSR